jgi:hypothetical protein
VTLKPSQEMQLLWFQKKIIGGKRTSCPWHEHRRPLLYSFKGQTTGQKVTIIIMWENGLFLPKFGQKMPVFLQNTQSLVIKQQAILAVGMNGHRCTRLKVKQQSATRQSCIQKWASLGPIWSKNDHSFNHIHNVIKTS